MARMYSRKKGKASSKKPIRKTAPSWVRYKSKEIEMLIVKLAREGNSPSKIGLILRDSYGIPLSKQITGKKITKILEEKSLLQKLPEDLLALIKRSIAIRKHLEKNAKDETAVRGLTLTENKIKALAAYYKKTKRLPVDWKYEPNKIRLYLE
ncbi:30S ribosomal protein S15 [Candidatus Woesearchaeota archaeon]|nr:30S ribosomal protein S15 [Candidatus Woesearchaeota archaeon]